MRSRAGPTTRTQPLGRFGAGEIFVMLNRGDYYQCALVIPKGGLDALKEQGLEAVRARIAALAPFVADRVGELRELGRPQAPDVAVDRLREWARPGLLCIGDAAHAMSPIGGVGINLAIQDAVAAANILCEPLRGAPSAIDHLQAVQRRRELPVRLMQAVQVLVQNRIIGPTLGLQAQPSLPWQGKLLNAVPFLRRIPARLMGLGFRPEHVRTPDVRASRPTPPAP